MTKYEPFVEALRAREDSPWHLTFDEIERILGFELPVSAYKYAQWWSNNPSNSVMTAAWRKAGWKSSAIDVKGRRITFKIDTKEDAPLAVAEPSAPLRQDIAVDLSAADRQLLDMVAAAAGESAEEAAARLLSDAIRMAAPSVRAERARRKLQHRSDLAAIDLDRIVERARDMH